MSIDYKLDSHTRRHGLPTKNNCWYPMLLIQIRPNCVQLPRWWLVYTISRFGLLPLSWVVWANILKILWNFPKIFALFSNRPNLSLLWAGASMMSLVARHVANRVGVHSYGMRRRAFKAAKSSRSEPRKLSQIYASYRPYTTEQASSWTAEDLSLLGTYKGMWLELIRVRCDGINLLIETFNLTRSDSRIWCRNAHCSWSN